MTDREPTPREEAAVRRLLRDARHDGPVPREVSERIEATLASLGAGGLDPGGDPGADPGVVAGAVPGGGAEHHRRRRAATALLVAAVSVVVVGLGIGQVVSPADEQESSTAASESAGDTARDTPPDRAGPDQDRGEAEAADGAAGSAGSGPRVPTEVDRLALVDDPPVVRESRFARDVNRVRDLQQAERRDRAPSPRSDRGGLAPRDPDPGFSCEQTDPGPGRAVAVRYEQAPALLVLRPPTRATQVADLVECSTGDVLRSLTLPQ